jgi:hypothetical protein
MPWPVIWKKPVVVQAVRMEVMRAVEAGEVGERR